MKQNRITNIPDYKTYCHDVAAPDVVKFKTGRETDPLAPMYKVETKSSIKLILFITAMLLLIFLIYADSLVNFLTYISKAIVLWVI